MQKVVVIRKSGVEEVSYDGLAKEIGEMLGIQKSEMDNNQDEYSQFHFTSVEIAPNHSRLVVNAQYEESYIYEGIIYNQDIVLLGLNESSRPKSLILPYTRELL